MMGDRIKALMIWLGWLTVFKCVELGLVDLLPSLVGTFGTQQQGAALNDSLWGPYRGWCNLAPLLAFVICWRLRILPGLKSDPAPSAAPRASAAINAPKGNPLRLWAVTFAWLIGTRIALIVAFGVVVGVTAAVQHHGDSAAIKAAAHAMGVSLAPILVGVTWVSRIVIVVLARTGKLPGVRKSNDVQDLARVFAADPAERAKPLASKQVPVQAAASAFGGSAGGFGRARRLSEPATVPVGGLVESAQDDVATDERMRQRLQRFRSAA